MLAPQLRQKIFSLWTSFWSSGMSNPIVAIEQITYLLFLKQIESQDAVHVQNGKPSLFDSITDSRRWSQLKEENTEKQYELLTGKIFPWLRGIGTDIKEKWGTNDGLEVTEYLEDAFFQLPKEKTGTLALAMSAVDSLFESSGSQNADLMGDIFEYLLDQLSTSGKNGQFRTPRHLIRFMIELLDPKPGSRVLDPAGGTAGFLTNTVLYHRQKSTPPEQLRLEWDGTPHRLSHTYQPKPNEFTGFDIDRTMVRIGWMNMVLHGITQPNYHQRDPLGKNYNEEKLYDYAFANPPYAGNVDKDDLNPWFPHKDERLVSITETEQQKTERVEKRVQITSSNRNAFMTDSSEILFVWLLLRALKPGGKMAVIVPEGLLFGSSIAHKHLRRTLIYDHKVLGVISLPQGVFNPYTGVKTSILIVEKGDGKPNEHVQGVQTPKTENVWFYEVASDGFTLGANRNPQPNKDNDLWDALEKWHKRNEPNAEEILKNGVYYQPQIFLERWRIVERFLGEHFVETQALIGQTLALQEIFADFRDQPFDLSTAEENMVEISQGMLEQISKQMYANSIRKLEQWEPPTESEINLPQLQRQLRTLLLNSQETRRLLEVRDIKENSYAEEHARNVLEKALEEFGEKLRDLILGLTQAELETLKPKLEVKPEETKALDTEQTNAEKPEETQANEPESPSTSELELSPRLKLIRHFMQLDGFNIYLKTLNVFERSVKLTEPKHWIVDVRTWRNNQDWKQLIKPASKTKGKKSTEPETAKPLETSPEAVPLKNSHDEKGKIRPEYIAAALDSKTQYLNADYLDSECIEANDFNLSASRYKPLQLNTDAIDPEATKKLLTELIAMEDTLRQELQKLLDMVDGRA